MLRFLGLIAVAAAGVWYYKVKRRISEQPKSSATETSHVSKPTAADATSATRRVPLELTASHNPLNPPGRVS